MEKRKEPLVRVHVTKALHARLKSQAALAGMSLRSFLEEVATDGMIARQIRDSRKQ